MSIVFFYIGFSHGNFFGLAYTSAVASLVMGVCLVISGKLRSQMVRFRQIESYSRYSRGTLNKAVDDISVLSVHADSSKAGLAEVERGVASAQTRQANIAVSLEEISADHARSRDEALATRAQVDKETRRLSRIVGEIDSIRDEVAVHRVHGSRIGTIEAEVHEISANLKANESLSQTIETLESRFAAQVAEVSKSNLLRILKLAVLAENGQDLLSKQELKLVSKDLSQINPVVVAWIYSVNEALSLLPLTELRRVSSHTRKLGYWRLSNRVLRQVISITKSQSDILALENREDELAVFEGKRFPQVNDINLGNVPQAGFILHVVGKVLPKTQSGYTLRTHYSAMAQIKAGYKVAVVALIGEADDYDNVLRDVVDEVSYFRFPGVPRNKSKLSLWLQSNVNQLADFVRRERPEALHAHSDFLNALVARVVGNHFGIPVVYESRGFWEESWLSRTEQAFNISDWKVTGAHLGLPEAYTLRQQMEILMRSKADHVITLAKVMKQHIVDLGSRAESVSIIPNAVDASQFPIVERDNVLVGRLGIPEDALVIGYISSIVEYEGIDILIRAFDERARTDLSEAHLLIVGDGAHLDSLKVLVSELSTPRVHFTGRVPHSSILSFYSVIDVFVVPRRPATVCRLVTPLKPFEAFSTGRAVVVSNVDALLEISQEGECARVFQAGDHLSLATELVSLAKDSDARKELGERAAEWVRTVRSWDTNAAAYEGVYSRLGVQKSVQM
ncbi:glycosyltransferase [Glutamicibacter sp. AOP5-A2-7]